MSACVQTPPSTIYATTTSHVQTVVPTTLFSTYEGSPAVDIRTVTTSKCNAWNICEPSTRTDTVLSTPTLTSTIVSGLTSDQVIITSFAVSTQTFPACSSGAPTGVGQFSQTVTMSQPTSSQTTSSAYAQFTDTSTEKEGVASQDPTSTVDRGAQVGSTPLSALSGTSTRYASGSSSASRSSAAGTASSAADESSGHKSNSRGAVLTGAIVGAFVLLALACFLFITLRKHCRRKEKHAETWGDEYWERRFQELDAEAEHEARSPATATADGESGGQADPSTSQSQRVNQKGAEGGSGAAREKVVDMDDEAWLNMPPKKVRLTLDLQSKDLPTRPPSTLSMISSFFKVRPLASPTSSFHARVVPGAAPAQLKQPRNGQGHNFSRPLRRVSGSTVASRHSHHSRKSAGRQSRLDRLSQLLPMGIPGGTRSSLGLRPPRSPADSPAPMREMSQVSRRQEEGERDAQDGRRGMEWVRTIFDPDAEDLPTAVIAASSHVHPGGLPPPPRQRSPPSTIYAESSGRHAHARDVMEMTEIRASDQRPVSIHAPGAPMAPGNTRQLTPPRSAATAPRATFVPSQNASTSSSSSADSSSSRKSNGRAHVRQPSKGKRPPDLALSRDALNASLWMEEDVEAVAPSADSAARQPMPISQFSPDSDAQRSSFNSTMAPVFSYTQPGASNRHNQDRQEEEDPYAGVEREKSVRATSRNTNTTKRSSDSTAAQTFGQFDQESWKTAGRRSGSGEESRSENENMSGPVTGSTTLVGSVGEKSMVTPTLPSLSWRGERLVSGDWGHLA